MIDSPPDDNRIAERLRRLRALVALWRDDDFRRDGMRLLWIGLRGLAGLRLVVALALLGATGAWIVQTKVDSPGAGCDTLIRLFGLATLLASTSIYAADQRQGTFELLWLARGSRRALLAYKVSVLLAGLFFLMVPAVGLVSWFLQGTMPVGKVLVFLAVNSLFIVAVMAWSNTLLPQAWAGGLLGAAIVVGLFMLLHDRASVFNPFLNPLAAAPMTAGGGAFRTEIDPAKIAGTNRLFVAIASLALLSGAAQRLHRAFR